MNSKLGWLGMFLFCTLCTNARVTPARLFQSNMVLQRDKPCKIWGTAERETRVTIHFNGRSYQGDVQNGKWEIRLPAQKAGGPYNISITGENTVLLQNVLFGDVWLCGGQSNMQFSVHESKPKPDSSHFNNPQIRLFTVAAGTDFTPQEEIKGGEWKIADAETVEGFSAVGFYFGSELQSQLKVPIGLISDNLGATAIEEWMSNNAIRPFPQFKDFYDRYIAPGKSMQEINADFEKIKQDWSKDYYLKNDPGLSEQWYLPQTNTSDWKTMNQPSHWEDNELRDFDGSVWFRKTYDSLPKNFFGKTTISLGQVDDYNICWVNGVKVGEGYGNMNLYTYEIPDSILKDRDNVIVVRVFDAGGKGGMYNMFWNPFLAGNWLYKKGVAIDAKKFKKPLVANSYIFGTPTILYNGSIAPLKQLAIKGFIWYQGEANTGRAATEYKALLPALIQDWRRQFNQGPLPFLIVQLPNLGKEPGQPEDNEWAELREAQSLALRVPQTGLAVTIDIGDADNLHPLNKLEVGRRLAKTALKMTYQQPAGSVSPRFQSMKMIGSKIRVQFDQKIINKNNNDSVRGFAIAGSDHRFHWARAVKKDSNSVLLYNPEVPAPLYVRYLWSGNPGPIDLYNQSGQPATPFRTDSLPLGTEGKTFQYTP